MQIKKQMHSVTKHLTESLNRLLNQLIKQHRFIYQCYLEIQFCYCQELFSQEVDKVTDNILSNI